MEKQINPGNRVKISENAMEEAPDPLISIKSKHAGQEGKYIRDMFIGEVPFAVIEFDDGTQDTFRKEDIEPL